MRVSRTPFHPIVLIFSRGLMKVLIIGSGGREHAICDALVSVGKGGLELYCAEGNAGISSLAKSVPLKPDEIEGLVAFAKETGIDFTFVGGETALVAGIVDKFVSEGLRIVGPTWAAARLEGSKVFSKQFMVRHGIPTAGFKVASSVEEAKAILNVEFEGRGSVIKADGLAAGKGVVVCRNIDEAISAVDGLASIAGEEACNQILIEERLVGREVSLLLFSDGDSYRLMPPVRDHKRLDDGDQGPNTGGMGTVCSDDLMDSSTIKYIEESIIEPTLHGAAKEGFPFKGILFVGLMIAESGPMVLEYNVRFGDPETQSLMMRLDTPLLEIFTAIDSGTLGDLDVRWRSGVSATVVLAAAGYPYSPRRGDLISGLEDIPHERDLKIFHAGTALDSNGDFVTHGGRVLGVSTFGTDLDEALARAYEAVDRIHFDGMQFRKDIGR